MTNEDVIVSIEAGKTKRSTDIGIPKDVWNWINANYRQDDSPNPHYKLYCNGYDPKYNRKAVDPLTMTYRELNFTEFYGNGVVD